MTVYTKCYRPSAVVRHLMCLCLCFVYHMKIKTK